MTLGVPDDARLGSLVVSGCKPARPARAGLLASLPQSAEPNLTYA